MFISLFEYWRNIGVPPVFVDRAGLKRFVEYGCAAWGYYFLTHFRKTMFGMESGPTALEDCSFFSQIYAVHFYPLLS